MCESGGYDNRHTASDGEVDSRPTERLSHPPETFGPRQCYGSGTRPRESFDVQDRRRRNGFRLRDPNVFRGCRPDSPPPVSIIRTVCVCVLLASSLKVENHPELDGVKLLGPMALFACAGGGNQTVAFHGRLNGVVDAVENDVHQLPRTGLLLSTHPAAPGATWQSTHSTLACGEF